MDNVRRIQVNQNMPHDEWTVVTINGETVYVALRCSLAANIHAIDIHYGASRAVPREGPLRGDPEPRGEP